MSASMTPWPTAAAVRWRAAAASGAPGDPGSAGSAGRERRPWWRWWAAPRAGVSAEPVEAAGRSGIGTADESPHHVTTTPAAHPGGRGFEASGRTSLVTRVEDPPRSGGRTTRGPGATCSAVGGPCAGWKCGAVAAGKGGVGTCQPPPGGRGLTRRMCNMKKTSRYLIAPCSVHSTMFSIIGFCRVLSCMDAWRRSSAKCIHLS